MRKLSHIAQSARGTVIHVVFTDSVLSKLMRLLSPAFAGGPAMGSVWTGRQGGAIVPGGGDSAIQAHVSINSSDVPGPAPSGSPVAGHGAQVPQQDVTDDAVWSLRLNYIEKSLLGMPSDLGSGSISCSLTS